MIWGIPAFRLPPGIIQEDIDRMTRRCPGMEVHLDTALGRDVTLDDLKARHDAVVLAIGAWWGKKMGIPGEDDTRVIDGVQFLRDGERGRPARDAGDGRGRGRRRRGDGCVPRREAPAGLQAREGDLPARACRDSGAQDRAGRRDRRGNRVRLPHPADRHRAAGQRVGGALRADHAGRSGRIRPPCAGERAGDWNTTLPAA